VALLSAEQALGGLGGLGMNPGDGWVINSLGFIWVYDDLMIFNDDY